MEERKIISIHSKHWKDKPFTKNISCCNPWRERMNYPFPENSAIICIDINSISNTVAVCTTDLEGRPSDLRIEATHWMELGDICKPGARKCRFVSPQEIQERSSTNFKNILHHFFIFTLIMCAVFFFCKTYFYTSVIDHTGLNIGNIIDKWKN